MSLLNLLDRGGSLGPFLAPYPEKGSRLFTFQSGLPYWLNVDQAVEPGWYHFTPDGYKFAIRKVDQAAPYEYFGYLSQLPRFLVYVVLPPEDNRVLVVPFNASDAKQRGWPDCQPQYAYLCGRKANLSPLSIVVCRNLAGLLLVEGLYHRERSKSHILEDRLAMGVPVAPEGLFSREEETAINLYLADQAHRKVRGAEDEIARLLGLAGAELSWYRETDSGYEITWVHDGYQHRQRFDKNFRCQVAGICLDGGDRQQDLVTVVKVMEEARRRDRFDYDGRPQ